MFYLHRKRGQPIQSPKPIIEPIPEEPAIVQPVVIDIPIITETREPDLDDDNVSLMSYNSYYETETLNKPPKKLNLIFNNDNLEYILPNSEEDKPKRKYKPKIKI
jgi:hypothetical protein